MVKALLFLFIIKLYKLKHTRKSIKHRDNAPFDQERRICRSWCFTYPCRSFKQGKIEKNVYYIKQEN